MFNWAQDQGGVRRPTTSSFAMSIKLPAIPVCTIPSMRTAKPYKLSQKVFWPNLCVGYWFQILDILENPNDNW